MISDNRTHCNMFSSQNKSCNATANFRFMLSVLSGITPFSWPSDLSCFSASERSRSVDPRWRPRGAHDRAMNAERSTEEQSTESLSRMLPANRERCDRDGADSFATQDARLIVISRRVRFIVFGKLLRHSSEILACDRRGDCVAYSL
jgi:hypothetical protein